MAYTLGMDVRQRTKKLINVDLYLEDRHGRLHLIEKARRAVHRLRHKLEHQIKVHLIFLRHKTLANLSIIFLVFLFHSTYTLSIGVVESLEFNNIRMSHNSHDLQLSVL